jgi:hypothetical protein
MRIKKSETVTTGNGRIYIKHRHFRAGLSVATQDAAKVLIADSREAVRFAIARLSRKLRKPYERELANLVFKTTTDLDLGTIQAKFERIQNGIAGDVGLTVTLNQKFLAWKYPTQPVSGFRGYARNNSGNEVKRGTVHLQEDLVQGAASGNPVQRLLAVRGFVHEASHKFANTFDQGYLQFRQDSDTLNFEAGVNPPKPELMVNADSYGWFAAILYLQSIHVLEQQ